MAKRIEKVNELIREVVSDIVLKNVHFPEGALVTVTRVLTSRDIHYANVFVTIFSPKAGFSEEAFLTLKRSVAVVQREFNKKLRMRPVPKITFLIDDEEAKRERIEKLLAEGRKDGRRT